MKKALLVFLLSPLLFSFNLMAQNWVNGGNALTANGTLGTTTNFSVLFKSNNSERGRLTNGGLWGFGTTAPNAKVHINSASSQIPLRVQVNSSTKFLVHSGGGVSIGSSTTPPANGLYVAGKLSIGNSAPLFNLEILSGSSAFARIKCTAGYAGIILDKSDAAQNGYVVHQVANTDLWTEGTKGNNNFSLYNWTLNKEALTVDIGNNNVGIGTTAPNSTLDVQGDASLPSINNINSKVNYSGSSDLVAINADSHPADGYGFGIKANSGYYGVSSIVTDGASGFGAGVYGSSSGTTGSQYGLYGSASGGTYNWAVFSSGSSFATGSWQTSDVKLKKDIKPIASAMDKLKLLEPRTYTFKSDEFKYMGLPTETQYGFVAQDMEKVLPELVRDNEQPINNDYKKNGMIKFKCINYVELIPIMTQALKEQNETIEQLKSENEQLINRLDKIEEVLKIKSSDLSYNSASLEQNQPNPFNQNTTIRYSIPQGSKGQINFYDETGKLVKALNVNDNGKLQLSAHDLSAGTYIYTLLIDGKVALSHQMLIIK